jgi:hypothetical protein
LLTMSIGCKRYSRVHNRNLKVRENVEGQLSS